MKTLEYSHCMIPVISELSQWAQQKATEVNVVRRETVRPHEPSPGKPKNHQGSSLTIKTESDWAHLDPIMNRKEIQRTTQHVYNSLWKQITKPNLWKTLRRSWSYIFSKYIPRKKWCREKTLLIKRDIRDWPVDYSVWIASKFKQALKIQRTLVTLIRQLHFWILTADTWRC